MRMKKNIFRILALILTLLPVGNLRADESKTIDVQYLVVSHADATESQFELADSPTITFNGDSLTVTCNDDALTLSMTDVTDYHFITKQVTTSIKTVTTPTDSDTRPTIAFGEAKFTGLKAGSRVTVYNIKGQAVSSQQASVDGDVTIDLSSLPKGIYILKTPTRGYKIMNK